MVLQQIDEGLYDLYKTYLRSTKNVKIKVYVNFILIKSLGTFETVRVNIAESNGMLVDTLLEN